MRNLRAGGAASLRSLHDGGLGIGSRLHRGLGSLGGTTTSPSTQESATSTSSTDPTSGASNNLVTATQTLGVDPMEGAVSGTGSTSAVMTTSSAAGLGNELLGALTAGLGDSGGFGGFGAFGGVQGPVLSFAPSGGGLGGINPGGPMIAVNASGTSTTTSTSTSSSTLTQDMKKLATDIQTIHDKSQVTPADLAAVRNDLDKLQSEATGQPDQTKLQTFESDIKALNGQLPTSAQTTQLETDFTAVLQSEGITDSSLITQTINDIQTVVQASNITATDVSTIAADQKAVQNDLGIKTSPDSSAQALGNELLGALTAGLGDGAGFGGVTMAQGAGLFVSSMGGLSGVNPGGPMIPTGGGLAGVNPGGPMIPASSASSSTSGTTTTSSSGSTLAQDMKKLATDLQAIHDKSQVTPADLAAVRNDLDKLQSEATGDADQTKVQTFQSDIKGLNGQLPTSAQTTQLEADLTAVLQSEGITDATLVSQAITDIEAVAQASNITASDVSTIAADRTAIQNDGGPSATTGGGQVVAINPGGPMMGSSGGGQVVMANPGGPMQGGPLGMMGRGLGRSVGFRFMNRQGL